jgi:hypothetical protein
MTHEQWELWEKANRLGAKSDRSELREWYATLTQREIDLIADSGLFGAILMLWCAWQNAKDEFMRVITEPLRRLLDWWMK